MKEKIKYVLKITLLFTLGLLVSCDENNESVESVELPILTTMEANNITSSSAYSGGLISEDGGGEISSRGVCWNTSPNPTIEDSEKSEDGAEIGSFNSLLPNLTSGTTYYVRAYAINEAGTAYGNEISFTTICVQPTSADFVLGHIDDYNDVVLYEQKFTDPCNGWSKSIEFINSYGNDRFILPEGLFLEITIANVTSTIEINDVIINEGESYSLQWPNETTMRMNMKSIFNSPNCIKKAECDVTIKIKGEVQDKSLLKYNCDYNLDVYATNTTEGWIITSNLGADLCCFHKL